MDPNSIDLVVFHADCSDGRKFHFIYKTTCIVTGKYYIGMHNAFKINDGYLGSGKVLRLSIAKYGKKNHVREILEMLPNRESLKIREKEIVNEDLLKDPLCMNLCGGGEGPSCFSDETKALISKSVTGFKHSEETKRKISASSKGRVLGPSHMRGKHLSEEHKRKIGESNRSVIRKPVSAETRLKISQQQKGRVHSEEQNRHISEAKLKSGFKHSEETKEKISLANKGRASPFKGKVGPFKGQKRPRSVGMNISLAKRKIKEFNARCSRLMKINLI